MTLPDHHSDLSIPTGGKRRRLIRLDDETIGAAAEKVARFFGTGRYLLWQTALVIIWIALNIGGFWWNWDPYPFILLNLAFSTQAAYAAPLILLAQNRQEDRDKVTIAADRRRDEQTRADTEFIARELAHVRLNLGDLASRDQLRREVAELRSLLERMESKLEDVSADLTATVPGDLADPTRGDVLAPSINNEQNRD